MELKKRKVYYEKYIFIDYDPLAKSSLPYETFHPIALAFNERGLRNYSLPLSK